MGRQLMDDIWVNRTGDSMSGPLALHGDPVRDAEAANKRYVDLVIGNLRVASLLRDGSLPMTGPLTLAGAPTAGLHATTRNYVDALISQLVRLDGTLPMTGLLTLSGAPVNPLHAATRGYVDTNLLSTAALPGLYQREYADRWQIRGTGVAADRITLQTPTALSVVVGGVLQEITAQTDIDLSVAANWDAIIPTDYTVAANRAGVDFYIYACQSGTPGGAPIIVLSDNPAVPVGYVAGNSRRVGGFHCLCVAVGAIGGHALTNFLAGDILTESVWDEIHRPACEPEGMVWSAQANIWVDIYLASSTGATTASVYNAVITDTRDWMDFVDDGAAVLKRLLHDHEFQIIAALSNEETNIAGGADPVTTGGHSDTAGRRMISDIGVEDACGALWQWLLDQSYRYDGGGHVHTTTITHKAVPTGSAVQKDQAETNFNANLGSGADETVNTSNVDPAPAWAAFNLPGVKGSLYRQGTYGDVKLLAGGDWVVAAAAGSRARVAANYRWSADAGIGGRFASKPR